MAELNLLLGTQLLCSNSTRTHRLLEPILLLGLAPTSQLSSQVECHLQPGIFPLEDLCLVETRLRRIFPPVATLLLEGPQLGTFRPLVRIQLRRLLPPIPLPAILLLRPLGIAGILLPHLLRPEIHLLQPLPPLPLPLRLSTPRLRPSDTDQSG